ncbi:MAG TPA: ATP-binding cassette domain-containing protein, partial [Gammaproteobacteria bacterium]|nr:ATP-binding cassette domain-containing protein [Gammaproteobacteria bacterium]
MALVTLRDVSLAFGAVPVLDHVQLKIESGERVCLIGRNGMGKSTLMKLICGDPAPDAGILEYQQDIRLAYLPQEVPRGLTGSVFDVVADGLGEQGRLIAEYHHISHRLAGGQTQALLNDLARVQHDLEAAGGWHVTQQVEATLSRMALDPEAEFSRLSGGLARRVLLARALVNDPQLLLLDEPTNHLDIEAIQWLQEFLLQFSGALLFVTHDRMLLRALATRIIELDRGHLESYPGNYDVYLKRKEEALKAEASQNALFDKRLAQEEAWIRQGIKARRTRNEGRVRALEQMREARRARRDMMGRARLKTQDHELSGRVVIEAEGVSYSYGDQPVIRDFSATILRGDKVGILGPNGAGKSTLLQLLLGRLKPDQGRVKLGTRLEVAYYDQHRSQLEEQKSVRENVSQGSDKVTVNGRTRHVISYLQDFLFSPARARVAVQSLSGGERNRLLLAKLFTRASNLLVMDEPTNDLDVETLELLEELLVDYPGTLLLVSHDRSFINNIVTSTLVLEGGGRVNEYVGGYDDWLRQRAALTPPAEPRPAKTKDSPKRERARPAGLGYKEQRELAGLPGRIDEIEAH